MKQSLIVQGQEVLFYSINLCSYGDKGDYELFAERELDLNMQLVKRRLKIGAGGKWSEQAGKFSFKRVEITIYNEGRVIMEGVSPDTHQAAFELLKEILSVP